MKYRLTERGLSQYTRQAERRSEARGELLYRLPSGALAISWPWGPSICFHDEVEECQG